MQSPPEHFGSHHYFSETFRIDKLGSVATSTRMFDTGPAQAHFFRPEAQIGALTTSPSLRLYRSMSRPVDDITIAEGDPDIGAQIEDELLLALSSALPQSRNTSFVLTAKGSDGRLIGGLTASTSYGWLLIKTLWVAETLRHQGLGRRLVTRAEERALGLDCHGAWLDTSNPEAMRFYAKLGYECFGQLANAADQVPASHRRWFMKKRIRSE